MSEKTILTREQNAHAPLLPAQAATNTLTPPPFQLKAEGESREASESLQLQSAPVQRVEDTCPSDPPEEPGMCVDYVTLARNVYDGMFGVLFGTDENKVYENLSLLNRDASAIYQFEQTYTELYGRNVIMDIHSEFSNSALWGPQLDTALNYLTPIPSTLETCPVEPEDPQGPQFEITEEEATGRDEILVEALEYANGSNASHTFQGGSINCSIFVNNVLGEGSETDQDQSANFSDPDTGLPVGYIRGNRIRLVTNNQVTNVWPAQTAAVIEANAGNLDRIDPNTPLYTELAQDYPGGIPGESFLFYDIADGAGQTFIGMEAEDDHEFGAGLVAQSMGGVEINENQRMPGDLQQTLKTDSDGEYTGAGHASIIWETKVTGIGYFDSENDNAPVPDGVTLTTAGWYSGNWIINGDTDPRLVASYTTTQVKLIDANTSGVANESGNARGSDATQIGAFSDNNSSKDNQFISNGRLPNSKWINWASWEQEATPMVTDTNGEGMEEVESD